MFLTMKDDYYTFVDDPILLSEVDANNTYSKPVDIRECYFIPVADMWANTYLDNLTLRNRYREYSHIEELPFSVRFSVNVFLCIKKHIMNGNNPVPFADSDGTPYLLAGAVLSAETNEYRLVYAKLFKYEPKDKPNALIAFRAKFILHGDVEKVLPITTYRYSLDEPKYLPFDTIHKSKQFIDFIDMEKRFYGKTAFIVIDHYRIGGRSLSKAIDMGFDR